MDDFIIRELTRLEKRVFGQWFEDEARLPSWKSAYYDTAGLFIQRPKTNVVYLHAIDSSDIKPLEPLQVIKNILNFEITYHDENDEEKAERIVERIKKQIDKLTVFSKDEELIKCYVDADPSRMRAHRKIRLIKHLLKIE